MRVYSPIGSKERFLEMFQRVNGVTLNEDVINNMNSTQILEDKFYELIDNELNVQHTNSQVNGNENYVEISGIDTQGNSFNFKIKINVNPDELDDVINIGSAELVGFIYSMNNGSQTVSADSIGLKNFNSRHSNELIELASNYADFGSNTSKPNELYEDAVNLIDKIPYKSGSEKMQSHVSYFDSKPTNDKVRVNSPELSKHVNEENIDVVGNYYKTLKPENKNDLINEAIEIVGKILGDKINQISKTNYNNLIKKTAMKLFRDGLTAMNETEYPESLEIGKEFKTSGKYPKTKKNRINKTAIGESDENNLDNLEQEKNKRGEILIGGKGDGKSIHDFDSKQILLGLNVESEHTNDILTALEVTIDHLSENPVYYTVMNTPEASAQAGASEDAAKYDDKLTDTLLGFEPKNVNEIIGADGATSAVGDSSDNDQSKYDEYMKKDFNNLSDEEKDEFFEMWKERKK